MVASGDDWFDSVTRRVIPNGIKVEEWNRMSLPEQLKHTFKNDNMNLRTHPLLSRLGVVYLWFVIVSCVYIFLRYIIPEYFEDYSTSGRYYITIFIIFLAIQSAVNWLCMRFYTSVHQKTGDDLPEEVLISVTHPTDMTKKRDDLILGKEEQPPPHADLHIQGDNGITSGGTKILMEDIHSNKTGLLWEYCDKCNNMKPPRAHHCKICNVCILKRDHHCYFTNTCVGFHNQRYFVVFLTYMVVACLVGLLVETPYLRWKLADYSCFNYLIPVTFYKYVTGELPLHYSCMVLHTYSFIIVGLMSLSLLLSQFAVIAVGKTPHEVTRHIKIKSLGGCAHNFRSVFGAYWAINWIFPAVLIFKQEGNGRHWTDMKKVNQETEE